MSFKSLGQTSFQDDVTDLTIVNSVNNTLPMQVVLGIEAWK